MTARSKSGSTPQPAAPRALHEPFSWFAKPNDVGAHGQLAARTFDVCNGITTILQILHMDGMDRTAGHDTSFRACEIESLTFLAIESSKMLAELAEQEIDRINDRASKEAAQ